MKRIIVAAMIAALLLLSFVVPSAHAIPLNTTCYDEGVPPDGPCDGLRQDQTYISGGIYLCEHVEQISESINMKDNTGIHLGTFNLYFSDGNGCYSAWTDVVNDSGIAFVLQAEDINGKDGDGGTCDGSAGSIESDGSNITLPNNMQHSGQHDSTYMNGSCTSAYANWGTVEWSDGSGHYHFGTTNTCYSGVLGCS